MFKAGECKNRGDARKSLEAGVVDFALLRMAPTITYLYWLVKPSKITDVPEAVKNLPGYGFLGNEDSHDATMVTGVCTATVHEVMRALTQTAAA